MPVTYTIDSQRGLIRTTCSGNTTLAEVLAHFDVLERDLGRPASPDVLLDLSEVTSLPNPDQLRAAASRIGVARWVIAFRACAIVVSRDALFGMIRMFQVFAHKHFERLAVFRNPDEARAWLESPEES